MIKRLAAVVLASMFLALPGCRAWDFTKSLPERSVRGIADTYTAIERANAAFCDWRRTKLAPGAICPATDPARIDEWIPGALDNQETRSEGPYEILGKIPPKELKRKSVLQEITPGEYEHLVIMKSKDKTWDREIFCSLSKDGAIVLNVSGPGTIYVASIVSISRDTALTNVRKYNYSITDENGRTVEVSSMATRVQGMWFRHTDSRSGSTFHIHALRVPEGNHTYTIKYRFSNEGDIMFKFLEPMEG